MRARHALAALFQYQGDHRLGDLAFGRARRHPLYRHGGRAPAGLRENGKGGVTIIQLLTHQGGFPNAEVRPKAWADHRLLRQQVCDYTLEWTPGSRVYYHGLSAHWVAAALIEAVTKQRLPRLHPQGDHRAAGTGRRTLCRSAEEPARPRRRHARSGAGRQGREAEARREQRPGICRPACPAAAAMPPRGRWPASIRCCWPAAASTASARSPRTIEYVTRNFTGDRVDGYMGMPMHRGIGPHSRGLTENIRGLGAIASPRAFGHGGVGSSYCWADPGELVPVVWTGWQRS